MTNVASDLARSTVAECDSIIISQIMLRDAYVVHSMPFYIAFFRQMAKWTISGDQFALHGKPQAAAAGENPSLMRQQFLSAKTQEQMLAWLDQTGILTDDLRILSRDQFRRLQETLTYLLAHDVIAGQKWLERNEEDPIVRAVEAAADDYQVVFDWNWYTGDPFTVIEVRTSLSALVLSTRLDKLSGARFGVCRFRSCPRTMVFRLESEHKRMYCSHECARADGQRRRRAEAKSTRIK